MECKKTQTKKSTSLLLFPFFNCKNLPQPMQTKSGYVNMIKGGKDRDKDKSLEKPYFQKFP